MSKPGATSDDTRERVGPRSGGGAAQDGPSNGSLVLDARDVSKSFHQGPVILEVLRGAALSVAAAERVAIIGASGSGKTTLLQILGGLDQPTR